MDEIEQLQRAQLDILLEIDRVCKKNNIQYCLAYGTCIGAIRHKGFIPWDDDIDLHMYIDDYEKLIKLKDEFNEPYFLQTQETDKEYGLMIGRVRNSNTTLIENSEIDRDINHGVFVDIYPLYNTPKKGLRYKKLVVYAMLLRLLQYNRCPQNRGIIMKVGSAVILKVLPKSIKRKLIVYFRRYLCKEKNHEYISPLYADSYMNFKYETFFPTKEAKFNEYSFPVPADADKYLKVFYGDYMKVPPVDQQVVHHDYALVDLEHTYKKYKGKIYCKERE